jgi:hypothetical protein
MELATTTIRPHLIPFFFEEMEGAAASYEGQKVKMIRLLPSSSLANYLYTQIEFEKKQQGSEPYDHFLLYLSIRTNSFFVLSGTIYLDQKGVKTELKMSLEKVRNLNNLLEDIFRTAMVFFIDGYKLGGLGIKKGIALFMDKYNFIEYNFDPESFRKMYYEQKKKKLLNRFQKRASNQVIGYF